MHSLFLTVRYSPKLTQLKINKELNQMSWDSGLNVFMVSLFLFHLTLKISSDFFSIIISVTQRPSQNLQYLVQLMSLLIFFSFAFIWFSVKPLFPPVAFGSLLDQEHCTFHMLIETALKSISEGRICFQSPPAHVRL